MSKSVVRIGRRGKRAEAAGEHGRQRRQANPLELDTRVELIQASRCRASTDFGLVPAEAPRHTSVHTVKMRLPWGLRRLACPLTGTDRNDP